MINHEELVTDNGFFTSLEQMKCLFSRGCQRRFTGADVDALIKWQSESRDLLKDILGFGTFEPCANKLYEVNTEDCGEYTRIKYVLQTEEKVFMPFFALLPNRTGTGKKWPAVICPNGHFHRAKESVAAVRYEEGVVDDMETHHTHYGEDFVKMGYAVFCPDARGFGERAEKARQKEGEWKCSCANLNRMAIPLGRCAIGMSVWDLVKLCDYIQTRPDCDPDRIGCAGLSGGGYQTLYLAAIDTRIKCACTSGYFYGAMESLLEGNENCDCNYVPDLWNNFDMGDIGSLIAPRPLIIETGRYDSLNGKSELQNVVSQFEITKKAYDLPGCGEKLAHSVFDGVHQWHGIDVYPFFQKYL